MSLILYFQLHEKLLDGVRMLLQDLFEHGSVLGLQVDGGPAEYTIRVRLGLCGNIVLEFLFSGPGESACGAATCGDRGPGGSALALIRFMQIKIKEPPNRNVKPVYPEKYIMPR